MSGWRKGLSLRREAAIVYPDDDRRHCAWCGDFIDPIDWCIHCIGLGAPCERPHRRLRLRSDAAFCGNDCRHAHRASYLRDCT